MIILDTNIVSEIYRERPDKKVVRWYAANAKERLFITTATVAELTFGIGILPDGRRKRGFQEALEQVVFADFAEHLLPFDKDCAIAAGSLKAATKRVGRTLSENDLMIAATTQVHGAVLATRNIRDFRHCGIPLQNPFDGPSP